MQVTISSGNNINGTLVLPLFEGEEALPEAVEGIPSALKGQINRVLAEVRWAPPPPLKNDWEG